MSTPQERVLNIAQGENSLNPGLINTTAVAQTTFTDRDAARIERLSNLRTNFFDKIAIAVITLKAKLGSSLNPKEEIIIALNNREPGF